MSERGRGVLYVITCGTVVARRVGALVSLAQQAGWTVCVVATPSGLRFMGQDGKAALEEQTGYPVRSEYRDPDAPDVLPPPGAVILAGATFNTVNKWAGGASDTLALGVLNESLGRGLPIAVVPFLNSELAAHFAFGQSVTRLREAGVTILLGPGGFEPQSKLAGASVMIDRLWPAALGALDGYTGASSV